MSQQKKVMRDIVFTGNASHTNNVEGNYSPHKVVVYEDFVGKAIDTSSATFYPITADAGCTATITAPHCLTLTKDADNEGVNVSSGADWYGMYNAACECRVRLDDVSATLFSFGFTDGTDQPPFSLSGTSLTSTATDAVMFIYDYDATTKTWRGVSVNGDTDGTIIDSGHTEADGSFATLRIELHGDSDAVSATFYLNSNGRSIDPENDWIGDQAAAVTPDTALYVTACLEGRDSGTDTVDIDYIKIWSDRAWGTST